MTHSSSLFRADATCAGRRLVVSSCICPCRHFIDNCCSWEYAVYLPYDFKLIMERKFQIPQVVSKPIHPMFNLLSIPSALSGVQTLLYRCVRRPHHWVRPEDRVPLSGEEIVSVASSYLTDRSLVAMAPYDIRMAARYILCLLF